MNDQGEKELRGKCGDCGHVWVLACLPIDVAELSRLASTFVCPKCDSEQIYVASEGDVK